MKAIKFQIGQKTMFISLSSLFEKLITINNFMKTKIILFKYLKKRKTLIALFKRHEN